MGTAPGQWHEVAPLSAIGDDEPHACEIGGQKIAVHRTPEGVFATSNLCTHGEALLSDGVLEGCIVECPMHFARFDVRSGAALTSPAHVPLAAYPVRVVDGMVEVCLPE